MIYVLYGRDRDDEQWSALTWSRISAEDAQAALVDGRFVWHAPSWGSLYRGTLMKGTDIVLRAPLPPLNMTRAYATDNPYDDDVVPELLPAEEEGG